METNVVGRTDILNGWKEISTYLRMGVRTAQRYEGFGLPVRRPAGKPRGSVIATKTELDTWICARPIRQPVSPSRPKASSAWTAFRASIAEMKRLHVDMLRLRAEVAISREALHARLTSMQGVAGMQGVPVAKLLQFPHSASQCQTPTSQPGSVSNWLVLDSRQRQAN